MSYQIGTSTKPRQSQKQEEQQHQQRQEAKSSGNLLENEIYSTTTIWLYRGNRPTFTFLWIWLKNMA
jgi:hypothetical protein